MVDRSLERTLHLDRSLVIRSARPEDATRLKEIGVTGWETTYADFITPENRQRYLDGPFWSVERLRAVISDPACRCLVGEVDGQVIGFLTVEPRSDGEDVELTRLYVEPAYRGKGVGHSLLLTALAQLQVSAPKASRLLVNVFGDNDKARRFYEREGFTLVEEAPTTVGDQTVADAWYARRL